MTPDSKPKLSTSSLEPARITETLELLARRIEERFPESTLLRLCRDLHGICAQAEERAEWISRPFFGLRLLTALIVAGVVLGMVVALRSVDLGAEGLQFIELIQVLEAGINDVVLIGAAVFFLFSIETRLKRRRALAAVHELRAVAHIIDMHQLTKDPERLLQRGPDTASSPLATLTPFELSRYLDYCTEMLSLVGKVAALYVQHFDDSVALASVTEVENLCTGLSRKIWQKIMIVQSTIPDPN